MCGFTKACVCEGCQRLVCGVSKACMWVFKALRQKITSNSEKKKLRITRHLFWKTICLLLYSMI